MREWREVLRKAGHARRHEPARVHEPAARVRLLQVHPLAHKMRDEELCDADCGATSAHEEDALVGHARAGHAVAQDSEVTRADLHFEYMLNALRLRGGFALRDFAERTGLPVSAIASALSEAERRGLITRSLERVQPTERGFDFLSDLQALFLPG